MQRMATGIGTLDCSMRTKSLGRRDDSRPRSRKQSDQHRTSLLHGRSPGRGRQRPRKRAKTLVATYAATLMTGAGATPPQAKRIRRPPRRTHAYTLPRRQSSARLSLTHCNAVMMLRPPRRARALWLAGSLVPQRERLKCSKPKVVKKPASRQSRVSDSRVRALDQGIGDAHEPLSGLSRCEAARTQSSRGPYGQDGDGRARCPGRQGLRYSSRSSSPANTLWRLVALLWCPLAFMARANACTDNSFLPCVRHSFR